MTTRAAVVIAASALSLLTACSGADPSPTAAGSTASPSARLLWMGDSVAAGEAVPLAAAAKAGGLALESMASEGGGNVSGIPDLTTATWDRLTEELRSFAPTVVVYQVSTFDWGTEQEQRAAYGRLLETVSAAGAELVFTTVPPIRVDDFYAPHVEELRRTTAVARAVADGSGGRAAVLDSAAVWGPTYQQDRDGERDRHPDGVHTCPQGAARFTTWLLEELARLVPGFTPAEPEVWANTGWAGDPAFRGC
ncbi:SGNH/GDSL hydrolase family protein [Umezawaea sp.]|uniref:SGNH/GDSL hydrolase family protein n=1 Tax=Umezawaea sp. TaxID=1955258 RepID=UPI002ED64AD5